MLTIGIDWGTQSSKWFYFSGIHAPGYSSLLESAILVDKTNKKIKFQSTNTDVTINNSSFKKPAIPLKKALITDPDTPFWDGTRGDTLTSLGNSIVFSLVSLLKDVWENVSSTHQIADLEEICFSFPNWRPGKDEKYDNAFIRFREAVYVAINIFRNDYISIPVLGDTIDIAAFNDIVNKNRTIPEFSEFKFDRISDFYDEINNIKIKYLPESIAAGLAYLTKYQNKIDSRRFLVVDIGAGSTDIGYMVTNQEKDPKNGFYFIYFPPAPSIGIAGEDLTQALKRAREDLTSDELAEAEKINLSESGGLNQLHYFQYEWLPKIKNAVRDYMKSITYHYHFNHPHPVRIICTGGSGAIKGLDTEIKLSAEEGLKLNDNFKQILNDLGEEKKIKHDPGALHAEVINRFIFEDKKFDEFETGRRAVSIGSAQSDKKRLKFREI